MEDVTKLAVATVCTSVKVVSSKLSTTEDVVLVLFLEEFPELLELLIIARNNDTKTFRHIRETYLPTCILSYSSRKDYPPLF